MPTQHNALYRFVWRWGIVPRAARFVCISEYVRRSLLATGVPSGVFPEGGLPELVEHGTDGWVCGAEAEEALREGMERVLDLTPSERRVAAEAAGRSLAQHGDTRETFAAAWGGVYGAASRSPVAIAEDAA